MPQNLFAGLQETANPGAPQPELPGTVESRTAPTPETVTRNNQADLAKRTTVAERNRAAARAAQWFLDTPHSVADKIYSLYLDAVAGERVKSIADWAAVDNAADPVAANRGRMAVRSGFLGRMLVYDKRISQSPDALAVQEELKRLLVEAGVPAEIFSVEDAALPNESNSRLYFKGSATVDRKSIESRNDAKLKAAVEDIKSIIESTRDGALFHPNHAEALKYLLEESVNGQMELMDGKRAKFQPKQEQSFTNDVKETWQTLNDKQLEFLSKHLTQEEIALLESGKMGMNSGITRNGQVITPRQMLDYYNNNTLGERFTPGARRRYALDAAGIIPEQWQHADAVGIDLQPTFANDSHPNGDAAAGISFFVQSDKSAGLPGPRDIDAENHVIDALKKYLQTQIPTKLEAPGYLRRLITQSEPGLALTEPVRSAGEKQFKGIRLNSLIPYTSDSASVYKTADDLQGQLNTKRLVLLHLGDTSATRVTDIKLKDGTIYSGMEDYAILPEGDPRIQELRGILGTVSESNPFYIGEPVDYPLGATERAKQFILSVDPIVHPAFRHTQILTPVYPREGTQYGTDIAYTLDPNIGKVAVADMQYPHLAAQDTKPGVESPIRTLIVPDDNNRMPERGQYYDGFTLGDMFAEDPQIRVDEGLPERGKLSSTDYRSALDLLRQRETLLNSGVAARDIPNLTPEQEQLLGTLQESLGSTEKQTTAGKSLSSIMPDLLGTDPQKLSKAITKLEEISGPLTESSPLTNKYDGTGVIEDAQVQYLKGTNGPRAEAVKSAISSTPGTITAVNADGTAALTRYDEPTPVEQENINRLFRRLVFVLRYTANKSNFYSVKPGKGISEADVLLNRDLSGIKATHDALMESFTQLQDAGLSTAATDAILRNKIYPETRGTGPDIGWYDTQLKTYAPAENVSSIGYGMSKNLPETLKPGETPIRQAAYKIYQKLVADDLASRQQSMRTSSLETLSETNDIRAPKIGRGGLPLSTESKIQQLMDSIDDPKMRSLIGEITVHAGDVQSVMQAVVPPEFAPGGKDRTEAQMAEWRQYVADNYSKALTMVSDAVKPTQGIGNIETPQSYNTKGIADALVGLSPTGQRLAIEEAYRLRSVHMAHDVDGDGIVKVINGLLHQNSTQSVLADVANEHGSIFIHPPMDGMPSVVTSKDGEIMMPKSTNGKARGVSIEEFINLTKNSAYAREAAQLADFAKSSGLKFIFDPAPGKNSELGHLFLTRAEIDPRTQAVISMPQKDLYNGQKNIEVAQGSLDRHGLSDMFGIVEDPSAVGIDGTTHPYHVTFKSGSMTYLDPHVVKLIEDGKFKSLSTQQKRIVKLVMDTQLKASHYAVIKDAMQRNGLEFPYTDQETSVQHIWNQNKAVITTGRPDVPSDITSTTGPFFVRSEDNVPTKTQLMRRQGNQAEQNIARLAEAAKAQVPEVLPSVGKDLEPLLQRPGNVQAKLAEQNTGFRPKGPTLNLTPDQEALSNRIKALDTGTSLTESAGRYGSHIAGGLGAAALFMAIPALLRHIQGGDAGDKQTMASLPTEAALNAAWMAHPLIGATANLGYTAMNHGDLLRSIVGILGGLGGGALGGAAGAFAGGVGAFAGSAAGAYGGSMAADKLYEAIAGPQQNPLPPNVAYQPVQNMEKQPTNMNTGNSEFNRIQQLKGLG